MKGYKDCELCEGTGEIICATEVHGSTILISSTVDCPVCLKRRYKKRIKKLKAVKRVTFDIEYRVAPSALVDDKEKSGSKRKVYSILLDDGTTIVPCFKTNIMTYTDIGNCSDCDLCDIVEKKPESKKSEKPVISDEVIKTLTESAAACWLEADRFVLLPKIYLKWNKRQGMFEDLAKEFLGDHEEETKHSALTKPYPERKKSHPEIIQAANGDIHIVFRKVKEFDSEDRYGVRDNVIVRRREHGKIVEVIVRNG